MNERDLIRQVLEAEVLQKDRIREACLTAIPQKERRRFPMKKRAAVCALCAVLLLVLSVSVYAAVDANEYREASAFLGEKGLSQAALTRQETKRVYRDIASERFDDPKTVELLRSKAAERGLTGRDMPDDPAELYKAILCYGMIYPTAALTSEQIRVLPAGLTYGEILERLGRTKDTGKDEHAYQYTVDGDKVLTLRFVLEDERCPYSGEELLAALEEAEQPTQTGNTFRAVLQNKFENERDGRTYRSMLVLTPNWDRFDCIDLSVSDDTVIVFQDGRSASFADVQGKMTITIDPLVAESYPPQGKALRIVIESES